MASSYVYGKHANHPSEVEQVVYSVFELCDDGGEVLSCEGKCKRAFHPTLQAGVETSCESIGFNNSAEFHVLPAFVCDNCKYQVHQCYVCGFLGSSDDSNGALVFQYSFEDCGYFYHPDCVSIALFPSDGDMVDAHTTAVAFGMPFVCPRHHCHVCKGEENKDVHDTQLAVCRRCTKSYHRKCLPTDIGFIGDAPRRAWDNVLQDQILIYCMDHAIVPHLETPLRNHVSFPLVDENLLLVRGTHGISRKEDPLSNETCEQTDVEKTDTKSGHDHGLVATPRNISKSVSQVSRLSFPYPIDSLSICNKLSPHSCGLSVQFTLHTFVGF